MRTVKHQEQQYIDESQSNQDHLEFEMKRNPKKTGYCFQISPEPHIRTIRYAKGEKRENNINLIPISIRNFVEKLEKTKSLKALI